MPITMSYRYRPLFLAPVFVGMLLSMVTVLPAVCNAAPDRYADLTTLSLEDLMNIEVTSVSKKTQKLSDSAAAVFVISRDDIRRSGAGSIPEVLRMAPGLEVARIDAHTWAVSSRGFNNRFSNKLLVLIDGRTVYTPLFSGVYWDVRDTMLEDIDRIEVIRGPGATMWGANAVNGVINIITRNARETQGGLLVAGTGTEERVLGAVRYGGALGENAYGRVYAKYNDRDDSVTPSGSSAGDGWRSIRGGFRTDWKPALNNALTLQGDVYGAKEDEVLQTAILNAPYSRIYDDHSRNFGGNILGRWEHEFSDSSGTALQVYYDRADRGDSLYDEERNTFDLDFQHRFSPGDRQDIIWGLGYRVMSDNIDGSFTTSIYPESRTDQLVSSFIQDDFTLIERCLHLIVGVKLEHNDYTGFEAQPGVRFLWTPDANQTFWTAISRAVRTPSRAERGIVANSGIAPPGTQNNPGRLPVIYRAVGNPDAGSEELLAFELGYRVQPLRQLSFDLALFYNLYDDLLLGEAGAPYIQTYSSRQYIVIPFPTENINEADVYGLELAVSWGPLAWWRFQAAYTFLEMDVRTTLELTNKDLHNPRHQFVFRSSMDLGESVEFDLNLRYVDEIPTIDIPAYVTFGARLAWRPVNDVELAVVGENLLEDRHMEFLSNYIIASYPAAVQRSVYGKVTWRF